MVPLPFSKLENLIPLLHERFEELKERHFISERDTLHRLIQEGYANRQLDCYVNDVDAPTHLLVLLRVSGFWECPPTLAVQSVYISRVKRGIANELSVIIDTVYKYAEAYGLKHIAAGAPCNELGEPFSKIWDKAGFVRSQISYKKQLP